MWRAPGCGEGGSRTIHEIIRAVVSRKTNILGPLCRRGPEERVGETFVRPLHGQSLKGVIGLRLKGRGGSRDEMYPFRTVR